MPPAHPLRRISTGSLSSLARSQRAAGEHDWLEPALTDLADEAATLTANMARMNEMHAALERFNEGFAAYLYALKINAFCVEWNEAPDVHSWERAAELAAELVPAPAPAPAPAASSTRDLHSSTGSHHSNPDRADADDGDATYATIYSHSPGRGGGGARGRGGRGGVRAGGVGRGGAGVGVGGSGRGAAPARGRGRGKATLTAAERRAALGAKKRREVEISRIIDTQLPLEYRGGDQDMRLVMEQVIDRLMDAEEGLPISAIVASPTLLHPRVNKALIALVAKKLVAKSSDKGKTLYTWVGQ